MRWTCCAKFRVFGVPPKFRGFLVELIAPLLVPEFPTSLIHRTFASQTGLACIWPASCEETMHGGKSAYGRRVQHALIFHLSCRPRCFAATMTIETTTANAVVCAAGVAPSGWPGPKSAAVVVKPPPVA